MRMHTHLCVLTTGSQLVLSIVHVLFMASALCCAGLADTTLVSQPDFILEESQEGEHKSVQAVGESKWWRQQRHEGGDFHQMLCAEGKAERGKVTLPSSQILMHQVCPDVRCECLAVFASAASLSTCSQGNLCL